MGNRHAVVVLTVGHERPPVVLALLDQVQLVATSWTVLDLPEFAGRRKRQAIWGTNPRGPGFRGRQIGAGKRVGTDRLRCLGGFAVGWRIDERNRCRT